MSEPAVPPPTLRPRDLAGLWIGCGLLSVLLHAPAFDREPQGDEAVYLVLADRMNWDLSNYNTIDSPVSDYPYSIYRQPLFHHGPLYPLLIKVGLSIGQPINLPLALGIFVHWLFLLLILHAGRLAAAGPMELVVAVLLATLCPLLMFSTTRLLHDGLAGMSSLAGLAAFAFAKERRSLGLAVAAGLLSAAALNMRFNSLLALPCLLGAQLFGAWRAEWTERPSPHGPAWGRWTRRLRRWDEWREFAVLAALVGTVGMQHFYRLLAEYGTLNPSVFIRPDENIAEIMPASQVWDSRTRLDSLWLAVVLAPVLLTACLPRSLRRIAAGLRTGDWGAFFVAAAGYAVAGWLAFSHTQLRYLAFAIPAFYFALPWLLSATGFLRSRLGWTLIVLTVISSAGTNCFMTLLEAGNIDIVPVFLLYLALQFPSVFPLEKWV